MKVIIIGFLKSLISESMLKAIVVAFGDHLVKSSKNKLDDAVWSKVRNRLG